MLCGSECLTKVMFALPLDGVVAGVAVGGTGVLVLVGVAVGVPGVLVLVGVAVGAPGVLVLVGVGVATPLAWLTKIQVMTSPATGERVTLLMLKSTAARLLGVH